MDGYFPYVANKVEELRKNTATSYFESWSSELKSYRLWRAVFAEFIATLLLVFIGTMSIIHLESPKQPTYEGIDDDFHLEVIRTSLTFCFMITVCIQMIGHISGGHMNPSVTLAMVVTGDIRPTRGLVYFLAQVTGGLLGSLLLQSVTPDELHDNLGATLVHPEITAVQGLICETVFTFILILSIVGCVDNNRTLFGSPALGIGITYGALQFAGMPYTGASMNPARSLSASVLSNKWDNHWIYWVGPIVGSTMAAALYTFVLSPYKNIRSYDDAINILLRNDDVIGIPRDFFNMISDPNDAASASTLTKGFVEPGSVRTPGYTGPVSDLTFAAGPTKKR